jgi:hypothetical protein
MMEINEILYQQVENYINLLISNNGRLDRRKQVDQITSSLLNNIPNRPLNIIETGASHSWDDGAMGLLFAHLAQESGGRMWMVDIDDQPLEKAKILLQQHGIDCVEYVQMDSVSFLKNFDRSIDIAHLDSWDLNLLDPLPSALHGWREFEAIKDKMNDSGIVIIDDNFKQGTWVDWNMTNLSTGETTTERVTVNFPCIGKGAHVLNWIKLGNEKGWKILDEGKAGDIVKLIFQKEKA